MGTGYLFCMDVRYFLKKRTSFLRTYYNSIAAAFENEKRKIEEHQPPYDNPPYSEDPEPPYLEEWIDADTSVKLTGLACISMLSEILKLYFEEVRRDIGFEFSDKRKAFRNGFVEAYRDALGEIFQTDWIEVGVDFALIEQIVLARNLTQHGGNITTWDINHDAYTFTKHPKPFFAQREELDRMPDREGPFFHFLAPSVDVNRERLVAALDQIDKLADWIEDNIDRARKWRSKPESEETSTA
ncbi:hypothetical protein [Sphingobium sp.]|uniref:hypothetical protein n=1 Tax=Sphingobium sp. TaxID=1912891 RepID=UPI0028BE978E|nr:hypothetical protein [Sphingobium sp.]